MCAAGATKCCSCCFFCLATRGILSFGAVQSNTHGRFLLDGNVAAVVDQLFLPGSKYFGTWDPEGILTTIPAVAVTIAGLLAGQSLTSINRSQIRIVANARLSARRLSLTPRLRFVSLGIVAFNLSFLWDLVLPINSYLWASSFCLLAIGVGLLLVGAFDTLLCGKTHVTWEGLLIAFGRNSLVGIITVLTSQYCIAAIAHRFSLVRRFFPGGTSESKACRLDPVCCSDHCHTV